jgi:hypothetical protein
MIIRTKFLLFLLLLFTTSVFSTEQKPVNYVELNPPLKFEESERQQGYVTFTRNPLKIIWPNTIPTRSEITNQLSVRLTPGETTTIPLYLHTYTDLDKINVLLEDKSYITNVGHMVYSPKFGHKSWELPSSGITNIPLYISESWPVNIKKDSTLSIWLTVKIPENIASGLHSETFLIDTDNAAPLEIKLDIDALPFTLDSAKDYFLALYTWGRESSLDKSDYKNAYTIMKSFGLTTIAIMAEVRERYYINNGKLKIKWSGNGPLFTAMEAYKETNFPNNEVIWLMGGGDGGDLYRWCHSDKKPEHISENSCYQELVKEVLDYGKKNNWPKLILQPVDEPFRGKERYKIAKNTYSWLSNNDEIELETNNLNGPHASQEDWKYFFDNSKYMALSRGPYLKNYKFEETKWDSFVNDLVKSEKEVLFYNVDNTAWHPEIMRFWYGYGLWQSKAYGFIQWSYQIDHFIKSKNDEDAIYKPSRYYVYYYPKTENHSGGASLGFIGLREGINDLKYLVTQQRLLNQCLNGNTKQSQATARKIQNDLTTKLSKINFTTLASKWPIVGNWDKEKNTFSSMEVSGEFRTPNGLTFENYNNIRSSVIDNIMTLLSLPGCN